MIVKPGEKIPLDGEVVSRDSSVNQAPHYWKILAREKATERIPFR
ncbi:MULTISPECIES: hypothetical protein [unclassified Paenibacillus]|nr:MULTISPECIES: hypothetical protein [unclassified Paenibacillus]